MKDDEYYMKLLKDPMLWKYVTELGLDDKIVGEEKLRKVIFLCAIGSLVNNAKKTSYNLMVNSESGAGKDHTSDNVLKVMPKGMVHKRTRIGKTTFTYWKRDNPNWDWDGKIVYLEDISNGVFNSEVFKCMCSSQTSTSITVDHKVVDIEVKGKPVIIVSSASANPEPEMIRRFLIANCDESEEQTKAIIKYNIDRAINQDFGKEVSDYHKALEYLKRVEVRLPEEIKKVAEYFPDSIIMRTQSARFLDFMRASCALHQYQREKDCDDVYICNGQDYNIAREAILATTSNAKMIPLTQDQKRLVKEMKALPPKIIEENGIEKEVGYTIKDLEPKIKFLSERMLYKHLNQLVKLDIVDRDKVTEEGNKKPSMAFRVKEQHVTEIKIPTWEELIK